MVTLDDLRRVAEIEFGDLVTDSLPLGEKLRLYLSDGSYMDLWLSRRLHERFGFHWERQHLDGTVYRYDNFLIRPGATSQAILTISMLAHKTR